MDTDGHRLLAAASPVFWTDRLSGKKSSAVPQPALRIFGAG